MKKVYRIRQNFKVTRVIHVIAANENVATHIACMHQGMMGLNGDLLGVEILASRDLEQKDLSDFNGSVCSDSFTIDV